MITYVNDRLNAWALWRMGGFGGGPGVSPYPVYNLPVKPDVSDAPPPRTRVPLNDMECAECDRAVCALRPDDKKLVMEFYCYPGQRVVDLEKRLGYSRATIFRRMHAVQQELLGYLNDMAAGIRVNPYGWEMRLDELKGGNKTKLLTA